MTAVSVIIPHLNQPAFLTRCLASLAAQQGAPAFEVIVVDNGSKTLPEAQVAAFETARLMVEDTPGPGPARNRGVGAAKGEILAFIDTLLQTQEPRPQLVIAKQLGAA